MYRNQTRGRRLGVLLTTTLLVVGLSACDPDAETGAVASVDDPSAGASSTKSDDERQLEFVRCMDQHGITVKEEKPDAGSDAAEVSSSEMSGDGDLEKAMEACAHLAPAGVQGTTPSAEELEGLRAIARCMRDKGVEVPDPDPRTGALDLPSDWSDAVDQAFDTCLTSVDSDSDR